MVTGKMNVEVKDKKQEIKVSLERLKGIDVLVGIPQKETTREGDAVTNAELLFIHTNGSPLMNIPPRPVIQPAIQDDIVVITKLLKQAMTFFINGDYENGFNELEKAGLEAQGASQDWFTNPNNGWAPNSPSVALLKIKKGSTDPKPLIDTGELRKSITYAIEGKEQK